MARPLRIEIFGGQKTKAERNIGINVAHMNHGYTLKEIADYLGISLAREGLSLPTLIAGQVYQVYY